VIGRRCEGASLGRRKLDLLDDSLKLATTGVAADHTEGERSLQDGKDHSRAGQAIAAIGISAPLYKPALEIPTVSGKCKRSEAISHVLEHALGRQKNDPPPVKALKASRRDRRYTIP
jgi:hypothetical protein